MKVYIVRYGEYSDQGIDAVFSNKEEAEKYCYVHNRITEDKYNRKFRCEEWDVDDCIIKGKPILDTYHVASIHKETGAVTQDKDEICLYTKDVIIENWAFYITVKSIRSYEQAKKIAIKQYQIYTQQKLEEGK